MSDESAPASAEVTVTPVDTSSNSGTVEVLDVTPDKVEAPIVEENKEAKTEEKPKEKIAKKLSKVVEREAKVAAREADADRKLAEANSALEEAKNTRALVESLKTSPSKVLSQLGISFNDLATALLSEDVTANSTPSEMDALKQELKDIKNNLQSDKDRIKADQDAALDQNLKTAITNIKNVIDTHIASNPDKYDVILSTDNQKLVYDIMEESYNQSVKEVGADKATVMLYTEACDLAENYLTDQLKKLASGSKKLKEFVSPPAPKKPERTSFGRTLSSQVAQVAVSAGSDVDVSKMSPKERLKHAARLIRFN